MTIEAPNHEVDETRWKVLAGQCFHVDSLPWSESVMEEESNNINQIQREIIEDSKDNYQNYCVPSCCSTL